MSEESATTDREFMDAVTERDAINSFECHITCGYKDCNEIAVWFPGAPLWMQREPKTPEHCAKHHEKLRGKND